MKLPYFILCITLSAGASFFYAQARTGWNTVDENISLEVRVYSPTPTPTPTPTSTSTPTPTTPSGGGGGGGQGPTTPTPAAVEFKGYAYPGAIINALKDGSGAGVTLADDDGKFTFVLSGLSGGTYNFGFWAQDRLGRRSVTFAFQLTLASGSTTKVSGVILPPTIETNKNSVGIGENITISGASTPLAKVRLRVASELKDYFPQALLNGDYSQTFTTGGLEKGVHTAKSRTELTVIDQSIFSHLIAFGVGVPLPQTTCAAHPDINNDSRVNIVDFSIMAYWWKRTLPQKSAVDLNCDGKLNLVDFSILAYSWTG